MNHCKVIPTHDKSILSNFFSQDPSLYAYQLGDLDPFFFDNTKWWICKNSDDSATGITQATLLLYSAFETPVILAFTDNRAQGDMWEDLLRKLPIKAHIHFCGAHLDIISSRYELNRLGKYFKMRWLDDKGAPTIDKSTSSKIVTLTPDDKSEIAKLHCKAYPGSYFDTRLLQTGACLGIRDSGQLVAIATCHVYSKEYKVAALGAIATDPDFRGRGYASALTYELITRIRSEIQHICLNVHSENKTAIGIYQRLGFEIAHEYEEALVEAFD